ncbi:hypothetical protein GMA12_00130 [Kocuria sediminis]|uniref:Uncharacterized protein n=1 Tax=Kocuria sediminis TaxID=1038857 RepID=A0A6N8GH49_9MICC|nr:hypothetical protein [Kocuria sediminis]MUN61577.1 hypothetical protein [Kocuria sediminis]
MGAKTKPFDWSATPASWAEIGQRTLFEIYALLGRNHAGAGAAEATAEEIIHAVDRAIRSVTPLDAVQAWVADKAADIPVVTP